MKSFHKEPERVFDMTQLQESIQPLVNEQTPSCKPCSLVFNNNNELRVHRTEKHPTYKPCRNFAINECMYGSHCDFNHVKLKPNEMICWDCGVIFTSRFDMMGHRKMKHPERLPVCLKLQREGYCSREAKDCWNSHSLNEQTQNIIEQSHVQDFPRDQSVKKPPILLQPKPSQENQLMTELLSMMKLFMAKIQ